MSGGPVVVQGDARALPLPNDSVDLVVTSPPYWNLRSYTDSGRHYEGQLGSEQTPQEFLENLWECTREWCRVLKPSGSMFVNLGDKYSGPGGGGNGSSDGGAGRGDRPRRPACDVPTKSLVLLPEAYRLGCNGMLAALGGPDPMGGDPLIVRSVTIWSKPNGL